MIVVQGRIIDFLINRYRDGYAEFIFKSDYDKSGPRFEAICSGKIPDVVPGVPIKIEFPVESVSEIVKIDIRETKIEKITMELKNKYMNHIAYACINYNDEEYAIHLLKNIKGISDKTANRILEAVDGDISQLSTLWDDKEFWKGIRGSKRYLEDLKNSVGSMLEKDLLVKKYKKYGIGYPQIDMLTAMYALEAEYQLCQNPYKVLYKLDLSFQVADNLAKDLGFDYLSEERVRAVIFQVLSDNEKNGNTAMRIQDFYMRCACLHRVSAWKDYVISPYYILAILSNMRSIYCENGLIGFMKTMNKEIDIAFQLRRLMDAGTELNIPEEVFESIKDKYNQEQRDFLRTFDKNSVTILLGRGGTGKTHTICGAIDLFKRRYPDEKVRLCAPTARAAGVLKEHSGHDSSTIHIMLELSPYESDKTDEEVKLLDAKLIVVDEMSMVDTDLMFHLLQAVKSGTKLILSGDPDQLESVGCGAVLEDLITSDAVPKVRLKKIMRQSEDSAVIQNCGKVLVGRHDFVVNDMFKIRTCGTESEAMAYLKSCYSGDPHCTQILSTTKKGLVGTIALNKEFEDSSCPGVWLHGDYFKVGDKVIFTKNNYDKEYCNGDIGFLETIQMPIRVKKQGEKNKIIEIDKDDAIDMEHADAITIHKSQGSEYDKVYILLPEMPTSLLTRNMVNTAISRAKKDVTLIVVNNALKIAASNRYKRHRVTQLGEKLKNMGRSKYAKEKEN